VGPSLKGILEYLLVVGLVLALALFELGALLRTQRRERRMRKGSKARTQAD
jgi:hypothetical protein